MRRGCGSWVCALTVTNKRLYYVSTANAQCLPENVPTTAFVCVFVSLLSSIYQETLNRMPRSPCRLGADTVDQINDDNRTCHTNWNLSQYQDSRWETQSADQYCERIQSQTRFASFCPIFHTERKILFLELMLGTTGEKTNVSVHPSIYSYFSAYLSHIVLATELKRVSGHFPATICHSSWGPKGTATSCQIHNPSSRSSP